MKQGGRVEYGFADFPRVAGDKTDQDSHFLHALRQILKGFLVGRDKTMLFPEIEGGVTGQGLLRKYRQVGASGLGALDKILDPLQIALDISHLGVYLG